LTLISAPVVARTIGPDGRGQTAAALALFLIVPVVLGVGIPLEVRRQAATSDGKAVIRTARVLLAYSALVSTGVAALSYYTIFSSFGTAGRVVATVGVFLTPLSASWALDVSVLVAHRRYAGVLLLQLLQPAVYVCLLIIFWMLSIATVATVLLASVVATAATCCAGAALVRVSLRGERVESVRLLRAGLGFAGSAIAEAASNRADQVFALPLIGAYQAGLYSVAATIGSVPLAIGQALGASYFAPIAQAEGRRRVELQCEAIRSTITIALVVTPLIALCAWPLIPVVFGEEFASATPVAMITLLGSAGLLTAYVASMALVADSKGGRMAIAQFTSLVVGIGCLFMLGPSLGAVGAAIASTFGYIVLLFALLAFLPVPKHSLAPRRGDLSRAVRRLRRDG
jgi:O-antigen/teichoic acid export membrane protein